MRKRKKTATPGCTTPGKSTHILPGGVHSGLRTPSSTPNKATTLTPQPSSLLPPWAVCQHSRDLCLFPPVWWQLLGSPPGEGTSATWSPLSYTLRPGGQGVVEAEPPKMPPMLLTTKGTPVFW